MQTSYETKKELAGKILAEFISHELINHCSMEEVYEINIENYWQDLKPYLIRKLKEGWGEDDLIIHTKWKEGWEEGLTIHTHQEEEKEELEGGGSE